MGAGNFSQDYSRAYQDDNTNVNSTTAAGSENTRFSWVQGTYKTLHWRVKLVCTGKDEGSLSPQLYMRKNAESYAIAGIKGNNTLNKAIVVAPGQPADGDTTTERLTTTAGTFRGGRYEDASSTAPNVSIVQGDYEYVWSLELNPNEVSQSDTIDLQVWYGGSTIDGYNNSSDLAFSVGSFNYSQEAIEQYGWAWYDDDSSDPDTCTAREGTPENTSTEILQSELDSPVMLRFHTFFPYGIAQTRTVQLQYRVGAGGTWTDVTASSSNVRVASGTPVNDTDCNTELLTNQGGTFSDLFNGRYDEVDGIVSIMDSASSTSPDVDTECQFCIQFLSADLSGGETIYFRLEDTTDSLDIPLGSGATLAQATIQTAANKEVTGTPQLSSPTASGSLNLTRKITGAVSTAALVIAGAVGLTHPVSGAVETDALDVSGSLAKGAVYELSDDVTMEELEVSGSLIKEKKLTGTPSLAANTPSGSLVYGPKVYLNSTQTLSGATEMTVTSWNTAGTSITFTDPVGAPTGSLYLGVENQNNSDVGWIAVNVTDNKTMSGAVTMTAATASGELAHILPITGSVDMTPLDVSGSLIKAKEVTGAVDLEEHDVTGSLIKEKLLTAAVDLEEHTVSGSLDKTAGKELTGAPELAEQDVSGSLIKEKLVTGAITLAEIDPAGSLEITGQKALNGAVDVEEQTVSGALIRERTITGAVTLTEHDVSGSLTKEKLLAGSPELEEQTVSGSLTNADEITGSPELSEHTVSGSLEHTLPISGAVNLEEQTVSGSLIKAKELTGAVTLDENDPSGSLEITGQKALNGAVTLDEQDVSGSLIRTPVAGEEITGSATTTEATASGAIVKGPKVYLNTSQTLAGATELPVTDWNVAGTSITFDDPTGAPRGSLYLGVENQNNSDVGWIAVTVLGKEITGAVTLDEPTPSGLVLSGGLRVLTGAATLEELTPEATVNVYSGLGANPTLTPPTASGEILVNPSKTLTGAITLDEITASGSVGTSAIITGSATVEEFTVSGSVLALAAGARGMTWNTWQSAWGGIDLTSKEFAPVGVYSGDFYIIGGDSTTAMNAQLERVSVLHANGLPIMGTAIWPIVRGPNGGIIKVSMGAAETPDGAVDWEGPYDFTIGSDTFLDFAVTGKYLSVRFSSSTAVGWNIQSYDLEYEIVGKY